MTPPSLPFYAKAKFSYKGTYPEDLVFAKGSLVRVLSVVAEGEWWKARAVAEDGSEMNEPREGNVPMSYFAILPDFEPPPIPLPTTNAPPGPPPIPLASRPKLESSTNSSGPSISKADPTSSSFTPSWKDRQANLDRSRNAPQSTQFSSDATFSPNWTLPSKTKVVPVDAPPSAASTPGNVSQNSSSERAPNTEEDEPMFASLRDRMAALNGRGLSVSGTPPSLVPSARRTTTPRPAVKDRPDVPASSASRPEPSTRATATTETASPTPPPLKPRPKLPASTSTSSSTTSRSETVHSAQPKTSDPSLSSQANTPPRLPPRLPPRRPSSNASIPSSAAETSAPLPPPVARRLPPAAPSRSSSTTSSSSLIVPAVPARLPTPSAAPTLSTPSNPPPPPRRQPNLPPPTAIPKAPPRPASPPPLTSSSLYPHPNAQPLSDEDLALDTQWYDRQPLSLPAPILAKRNCRPTAGAQFAHGGGASWLKLGLLYGDRSRSFVTLSWGGGIPASQPRVEQIHLPPPERKTEEELEEAAVCYGERVARWCEEREGTVVGRGDCWDLPDQAIKGVSEELREETGGEFEGLAEAVEHSFGEVVYVNVEGNVGWGVERRIRRGDVLQFVYATFKSYFSDGSSSTSTAGTPTVGHSAVVIEDWAPSAGGGTPIQVLQSNVGGSKATQRGEFRLSDLVSGEVRAFRVMDEASWGGGPARVEP